MRLGIDASNVRAGGGLTHLVELLRAARPLDYGIDQVLVWGGGRTIKELPVRPWLTARHEPLLDGPLPSRVYWQNIRFPKLAKNTCDILFFPGGIYLGNFRPYVVMSQNLLPFANIPHRHIFSRHYSRMRLLRFSQSISFRKADGLIFLTNFAYADVMRVIKKIKGEVKIIPHGVSQSFVSPPRIQRPIDSYSFETPFSLLYISYIALYKHHAEVINAVSQLRKEGLPIKLNMAGGGSPFTLQHLDAVIKNFDPNKEFLIYRGSIAYQDMMRIYQEADMFVFASSCETISMPLIEAMAGGLPIACSDRGPMPEVLGDAGAYFNPEDPEDIANSLRKLIRSTSLRSRYAQAAYERAKGYSWEQCAKTTFGFLAEVARKRG
jgi:glycosyltransferase involved in cell wall biosynthesis